MDKNIQISMLLDIYGKLLTDKQYDALDLYYNQNLSLSEISEEFKTTRQGARKSIVDGEKKLFEYEEKLHILKERTENQQIIEEIIKETEDIVIKEKLQKLLFR